MLILELFWAGQLVGTRQAASNDTVNEVLDELRDQLKSKTLTHISCGTCFILQELCVDVKNNGALVAMYNLKV